MATNRKTNEVRAKDAISSDKTVEHKPVRNDEQKKESSKNIRLILVGLIVVIVLAVIFMRGDQLEKLAPYPTFRDLN